jgi:hypothetical protein
MVISIKPFSCMPSTQSDGVQTKISNDIVESLFVSVDTTGDAEVNIKSRILMKLHEAQKRATREFEELIEKHGIDATRLKQLALRVRPSRRIALRPAGKYVSTAAALVQRFSHKTA